MEFPFLSSIEMRTTREAIVARGPSISVLKCCWVYVEECIRSISCDWIGNHGKTVERSCSPPLLPWTYGRSMITTGLPVKSWATGCFR